MNYKVMNRPMFKMGGSTTPRKNYENGTEYPTTSGGFLDSAMAKYRKQQESVGKMGGFDMFKTLARSKDYLQQDTNNPLEYISNIVSNPNFLGEVVLPGMADKKKREMTLNDPKTDLAFAKALQPKTGGFATREKSERAVRRIQGEISDLRVKLEGATPEQQEIIKAQIGRLNQAMRVYLPGGTVRSQAIANLIAQGKIDGESPDLSDEELIQAMIKTIQGYASGGRVDRQIGTPMMGEQPMQQEAQMIEQPMQQENQMVQQVGQQEEQDPYKYLRDRLPPEIPDPVVRLIAYNKEAFNDFASIEAQDDVDQFNQKYNVELVVNV